MHTSTSGGSSDTEVKELAANPDGPSGPWPVTTVTPVAKWPRIVRKRALSTPPSFVSGGSGGRPEGSMSARRLSGRGRVAPQWAPGSPAPPGSPGSPGSAVGRRAVVAVGPGHEARAGGEDQRLDGGPVAEARVDGADGPSPAGQGEGRVEAVIGVAAEGV